MAYGAAVISTSPSGDYLSPYDPIIFECTWAGTSTADPISGIRMECVVEYDLNVGTSSGTQLGRISKQAITEGGSTFFRFNVSDILKTYVSHEYINLPISSDVITSPTQGGGLQKIANAFKCIFIPKYIDVNGVARTDTSATSSNFRIVNHIIGREETTRYIDTNSDYLCDGASKKFLTKSLQNKVIRAGEDEQLSFLIDTSGITDIELHWQTYTLGGTANTAANNSSVDCSPWGYGTFTISDNGANTIIDDFTNISKVDVWIEAAGSILSEKKTFNISQKCEEGYRLWWGNSLGGGDKYTFNKYTNKTLNVSNRYNFMRPSDSTPTLIERTGTTLKVASNYKFTGISDFIKKEELPFFIDLINSNDVYFQPYINGDYSDNLHPVLITTNELVEEDSDGLVQVAIEFMYAEPNKTLES